MNSHWISGHAIIPDWPSVGGEQRVVSADEAEAEIERMKVALISIAAHFDSSWPERCQSNVLTARRALRAAPGADPQA